MQIYVYIYIYKCMYKYMQMYIYRDKSLQTYIYISLCHCNGCSGWMRTGYRPAFRSSCCRHGTQPIHEGGLVHIHASEWDSWSSWQSSSSSIHIGPRCEVPCPPQLGPYFVSIQIADARAKGLRNLCQKCIF